MKTFSQLFGEADAIRSKLESDGYVDWDGRGTGALPALTLLVQLAQLDALESAALLIEERQNAYHGDVGYVLGSLKENVSDLKGPIAMAVDLSGD